MTTGIPWNHLWQHRRTLCCGTRAPSSVSPLVATPAPSCGLHLTPSILMRSAFCLLRRPPFRHVFPPPRSPCPQDGGPGGLHFHSQLDPELTRAKRLHFEALWPQAQVLGSPPPCPLTPMFLRHCEESLCAAASPCRFGTATRPAACAGR